MIKRRQRTQYTIGNKRLYHSDLHGERFYDWFNKTFDVPDLAEGSISGSIPDKSIPARVFADGRRFTGQEITAGIGIISLSPTLSNPCTRHIHSKRSGAFISRPPNMTATIDSEYDMLGDGHFQPSPPPIQSIESEAGTTNFFNDTQPLPHSCFGQYSSQGYYSHGRNALI